MKYSIFIPMNIKFLKKCSCGKYKKDINKWCSVIKSGSQIEIVHIFRLNNNLTDKTFAYLNPAFEWADSLRKRAIEDCIKVFHRINYNCVIVIKFNHATHGTTNYFTLTHLH